jgi:hypothetical protein
MPLRSAGRRNSIAKQQAAISRWLVKFGDRRPSEAAMEVTGYSSRRRRMMFNSLAAYGCIEYTGGQWVAVKSLEEAKNI